MIAFYKHFYHKLFTNIAQKKYIKNMENRKQKSEE